MITNPKIADVYAAGCPSRELLERIGNKWVSLVIGLLEDRTLRFSDLKRSIGGISSKMLAQTLQNLECDGLVTRTVYPEIPPRVEYALTPLGRSLCDLLTAMQSWAEEHLAEVTEAKSRCTSQAIPDNRDTS
jgi:DNA-binding HxlR family transcriptional regulator